jgi:hypothetical protein
MAKTDPTFKQFAETVKRFYQALKDKDWAATYQMRTKEFRYDVSRELYLTSMSRDGKNWALDDYKILGIVSYGGSNGYTAVRLIMEFNEGGMISYNAVWWKKDGTSWFCDHAGPSKLALFNSTRIPCEAE